MCRRHNVIVFALILLLALTICQVSAWSARRKHIQGFHVVKRLTKSMVAGSAYEWEVSFVNPKSEEGLMNVTLEVKEEKTVIGFAEFHVEGTLESYDNPPRQHHTYILTFTENSGGIFQSLQMISEGFNIIKLRISSVPNLMPGKYTFTLTISIKYQNEITYLKINN